MMGKEIRWPWVLALLALAAVVTWLAIVLTPGGPETGDATRASADPRQARVVELKSQAESLAIEGKLKESHAKYRELEQLVGAGPITEPALREKIDAARKDQERVYRLLLAQMERQRAAAATMAATPAIAPAIKPPLTPPPVTPPTVTPPGAPIIAQAPPATQPIIPPPDTPPIVRAPPAPKPQPATIPAHAVQFLPIPRGPVSDEQIGEAIARGVEFVLTHFEQGELKRSAEPREAYRQGVGALCVYALASSGKAIADQRLNPRSPEMIQMLERLKSYEMLSDGGVPGPLVYSRALRACALATYNRPQDRDVLEEDVAWLINAATNGAYTYDDRFAPTFKPRKRRPTTAPAPRAAASDRPIYAAVAPAAQPKKVFENTLPQRRPAQLPSRYQAKVPWDNSNSQYGVLGVWAGAEVGCEVPSNYWRLVQRHWTGSQLPTGEWNYSGRDEPGRFSMTVAGIASLLVTHDYLEAPLLGARVANARQPYSQALSAGLSWLEDDDNALDVLDEPLFYVGYNLFGLERVGLASGFKHFGPHDWFVELSSRTLPTQWPNGAIGVADEGRKSLIETAYALLFLSRGRHPIMVNKLRYDGAWSNRPREIANLAGYTSRQLERPVNWQVVDITRDASDWADAPILFISGNRELSFDDDELRKLRAFVDNGGLLFTHADLGSEVFSRSATQLATQLFPEHGELADLADDHAIFNVNFPITQPRPRMMGLSNGVRLLMLHCPVDLSSAWQTRAALSRKDAFNLGANIYLYTTGKQLFRNRLDTPIIPAPDHPPLRQVPFARLKHAGNWDPEPAAWPRFARKLHWETGAALQIESVPMAELSHDRFRIAHLTATDRMTPDADEIDALKRFLASGGTLLIDAAGGSQKFADAEAAWLPQLLGDAALQTVREDDPLLKRTTPGTADVPSFSLRLYALQELSNDTSQRLKIARVGKGRVIFTPLDITSALLGTNTWGIVGYLPDYSEALVRNVVMTTLP